MGKDLKFECEEELAVHIIERVEYNEDLFVSIVGKFEEIKNMLKVMFYVAEVDFENLKIESSTINDYADEYLLECWCEDGVLQMGCEPAKRDGKYLDLFADETYILENCSSKIVSLCGDSNVYFVNFDEYCDCDCSEYGDEECCCDCHCDDRCDDCFAAGDDELHGFTASKTTDDGYNAYSFYTTDKLSKNDICKILKAFGF